MATLVVLGLCHPLAQEAVYFLEDPPNLVLEDPLTPLLLLVVLQVDLHVAQLASLDLMEVPLAQGQCIQGLQDLGDPEGDLDILHLVSVDLPQMDPALVDPPDGLVTDQVHIIHSFHPILHGDQGGDLQVSLGLNIDQR